LRYAASCWSLGQRRIEDEAGDQRLLDLCKAGAEMLEVEALHQPLRNARHAGARRREIHTAMPVEAWVLDLEQHRKSPLPDVGELELALRHCR
jgi:hypothetical protein